MKTNNTEITNENALNHFEPDGQGAYATCRLLAGQWEQANMQEWAERGTINGKPATVFWLFENNEAEVEDGADMPFDAEHVSGFEIEEDAE